jgi:FkbM family methyltransferase
MPFASDFRDKSSGIANRDVLEMHARRFIRRRSAKGTYSLSADRILTTNPDGHKMYLDAEDISITPTLLIRRLWEPGTTRLLRRLVHPGQRVLEVGANIGWYTLQSAERVGPRGHVRAFEPNPRTFDVLHDNIWINGFHDRVIMDSHALSRTSGEAILRIPGNYNAGSHLRSPDDNGLLWMNQKGKEVKVQTSTLDEALSDNLHYDVLKIDVEGFEPEVFAGGKEFFAANPDLRMIMEFTPVVHGKELLDWFRGHGYKLHTINRLGRTRPTHDDAELMAHTVIDLFITG